MKQDAFSILTEMSSPFSPSCNDVVESFQDCSDVSESLVDYFVQQLSKLIR
jgi:hypothetical protein